MNLPKNGLLKNERFTNIVTKNAKYSLLEVMHLFTLLFFHSKTPSWSSSRVMSFGTVCKVAFIASTWANGLSFMAMAHFRLGEQKCRRQFGRENREGEEWGSCTKRIKTAACLVQGHMRGILAWWRNHSPDRHELGVFLCPLSRKRSKALK